MTIEALSTASVVCACCSSPSPGAPRPAGCALASRLFIWPGEGAAGAIEEGTCIIDCGAKEVGSIRLEAGAYVIVLRRTLISDDVVYPTEAERRAQQGSTRRTCPCGG